ncbi:hypothetical protein EGW08_016188 [Elysia chlorotica]|uniref:Hexosyltransferase n=1 Tax=Elysia chlorotica TaxID=188477 RepID=A0A433T3C0_ELYCH|nr:hypothetical protein EGW08_016188 [Elysia chlorotica]
MIFVLIFVTYRKSLLAFVMVAGVSAIQWLYLIGVFTRTSSTSTPKSPIVSLVHNKTRYSELVNTQYKSGVELSEQELLHRVDKLFFMVKPPSKVQLEDDLYFSPSPVAVETYNNSVLQEPAHPCSSGSSDDAQVYIIVPSSPQDEETRNAIRETWGSVGRSLKWPGKAISLSSRLTFVLGLMDKENSSLNTDMLLDSSILTKGHGFNNSKTNDGGFQHKTHAREDDILQFDMIDSYKNLTRKIVLAMQWVVSTCNGAQYILKVDQDVFVNVPLLLAFLKHHGKNNSIYGHIFNGGPVEREGRWGASKLAYPPEKYPVYAAGTAYAVSRSAAETVLKLCPHFPYVPIEDAFITGVLASVGSVDRVHVAGFTHFLEPKPLPCAFINDKRYVGNGMTVFDLRRIWRRHIDRGRDDNC